jgi:butyryl-CoA dehydrogenase
VDYFFTEQQQMIIETAREITNEKIIPIRAELDEKNEFPREILQDIAKADLFSIFVPEEYGGLGGGCFDIVLAMEELARGCVGVATSFAASALGIFPVLIAGTEEQKQQYMPDIASGARWAAFGLTEANAGSDASGIRTTAVLDGDEWILNGTKQWITNGGESQIYTIVAMTDPNKGARGASIFVVEDGDPGFSYGKKEDKMGIRSSSTRELIMKDCRIPKDRLVGRRGTGFITVMKTLDMSRPGIASLGVGLAQAALDEAVLYTKQRVQFGKPIIALGCPTYAGGDGHPGRGRSCSGVRRGQAYRCPSQGYVQGFFHVQGLCHRHGHEGHYGCRPGSWRIRLHERVSGGEDDA